MTTMNIPRPELEILEIPPLDAGQCALLDNHSVLNVLNVVVGELTLLGIAFEADPGLFSESLALCDEVALGLREPAGADSWTDAADRFVSRIEREINEVTGRHLERLSEPEVSAGLVSLQRILAILRVRAHELLRRHRCPHRWEPFSATRLRESLIGVLAAMEAHSRGRFRIVYAPQNRAPTDYYVDLDIRCAPGESLLMPPVVVDVMRDLIANARKYTEPGGIIYASLRQVDDGLQFVVQDNGRGIPEGEIEDVVAFGIRGSNVGDVRTMGGGFGLTKAFTVIRRFGGRFWIASQCGVGTRIRFHLPSPEFSQN